jgi:prolyl oligopeptidase
MKAQLRIFIAIFIGCGGGSLPEEAPLPHSINRGHEASAPASAGDVPSSRRTGSPPIARREDVVDTYHGFDVLDPYRWMETPSDEFDKWLTSQNDYARRLLDGLPGRATLLNDLRSANRAVVNNQVVAVRGDPPRIFTMYQGANDESPKLIFRHDWAGTDRILVEPSSQDVDGSHWTIGHPSASPDGRYVAYRVSRDGTEDGNIRVVEVDSGRLLDDVISGTPAPMISWLPDGRSFLYWRRGETRETSGRSDWYKGSATYRHTIGTKVRLGPPIIGSGMTELAIGPRDITRVEITSSSRWALASARPGPTDAAYFVAPIAHLRPGATPWRGVARPDDKIVKMLIRRDRAYALTYDGAPRYRVVSFDVRSDGPSAASVFVAESDLVLKEIIEARDAMYVVALDGGIHRLLRIPWDAGTRQEIKLPFEGSMWSLTADPKRPGVVFSLEGWTRPPVWLRYDGREIKELYADHKSSPGNDVKAEEVRVKSGDGAMVPLSIVRRADKPLNAASPVLLSGYGAYASSFASVYSPNVLTWLRHGGIFAVCHVRGDGVLGEPWHLAGIKQNKENGINDYIACAEYLVSKRYTSPTRLIGTGASAGGIIVGGAITKRPKLFRAAVLRVPVLNLLRSETTQAGRGNIMEFGTVAVESEFRSMLATDPYHRVTDDTEYPAVLITAGANDPRIPTWQPGKFAARLQAASKVRPTLLRIDFAAGHGIGSTRSQREDEYADIYAFAFWQAGVEVK